MTDYVLSQTATQIQSAITKVLAVPGSKIGSEYYIDVTAYGIIGDGATNNSTAMQELIDATTPGVIYFPPGDYCMTDVNINKGNIFILGTGPASRIINNGSNTPAIVFGNGSTMIYDVGASDLFCGQKSGVTAVAGNAGLRFTKTGNTKIRNISTNGYPIPLYDGIVFDSTCSPVYMYGCDFSCNSHNGITANAINDFHITDTKADANGNCGLYSLDMNGSYLTNFTAWNNAINGIFFDRSTLAWNWNLFFTDCVADSSGNSNWIISNATRCVLNGCWGSTQNVATGGYNGFNLTSVLNSDLIGCFGVNNNSHGLYATGCRRVKVIGGHFDNNNIANVTGTGITLNDCVNCDVLGASALDEVATYTQAYGVVINSGCSYITVKDNFVLNNTTGQISNAATVGIKIENNQGYVSEKRGRATILSGQASIAVTHGLVASPTKINVTGSTADTNALYVDTIGTTTFTVRSSGNVGGNRFIYWDAEV